jgi:taurine--2-oxoglutarate transaminase
MNKGDQGLSGDEIVRLNRQHVFFPWSVQKSVDPIPVVGGEGITYWDARGRRYLDFSSQLMNLNIGYQHPKVVAAIQEQAARLCAAHPGAAHEPKAVLGQRVAEVTPGDLNKVFFTLGGAEANENAVKFARQYTGRQKILARYISYHGATYGAISLSGDYRRPPVEPGIPGVIHTAALIMEGVTGSNGILVPPDDYWPRLREITRKYGILLISDEVMTGFGRTGKWFAVDHWDVVPDIMTIAKGLTSGYLPLGAVVVSDPIAEYFEDKMLYMGLTYFGHPMSCAAGIATLDVYKQENLIENSRRMGEVLAAELARMKAEHPAIGDVRSIGLFSAIELVKDREGREPMGPDVMNTIKSRLLADGLTTFINKNMVFVCPPLIITQNELLAGMAIIERAIAAAAA